MFLKFEFHSTGVIGLQILELCVSNISLPIDKTHRFTVTQRLIDDETDGEISATFKNALKTCSVLPANNKNYCSALYLSDRTFCHKFLCFLADRTATQ